LNNKVKVIIDLIEYVFNKIRENSENDLEFLVFIEIFMQSFRKVYEKKLISYLKN